MGVRVAEAVRSDGRDTIYITVKGPHDHDVHVYSFFIYFIK